MRRPPGRPGPLRRPGPAFWLAAGWLALVVAVAAAADLLPLPRYDETLAGPPRSGPSAEHPFGTDALGRDLLSRVAHGARVSLGVGVGAVLLGLAVGAPLGVLAGYRRRRTDAVIMGANDVALAFPAMVFALAVVAFTGASLVNVLAVLGVLGVPAWVRLVRGTTMVFAEREFVTAARALGARDRSVLWREIAPNVALPAASYAFVGMAVTIVAEGGLAFLGLSVQAPTPTWGGLINEGRPVMETAPHAVLLPSCVMFLTVLSANLVGDRLRALTDVRQSGLAPVRPRRDLTDPGNRADPEVLGGAAAPQGTEPHRVEPGVLLQVAGLRTHLPTPRGTVRAVDGVSLTLRRGRTLAVVGESGSGKSMLIRSILGLVPGTGASRGGRVYLDGNDITGLGDEEMRRVLGTRFGSVFQDPMTALNPVRRIGVQVSEPLRVHLGTGAKAAWARGTELLASVGIPEPARVMRRYPHQLSGGMRQRVTIAMALACGPDVLFADEPTTALDVTVQDQVLRLIRRLREENDMAVVLVSHDLSVVAEHADEVAVMYAGRVVERGPAAALFERARMPYTEALLAAVPKLTDPAHHPLRVIAGHPPDLADPPPGCSFQPRCPHARPRCAAEEPPLFHAGTPGHLYACWYPRGIGAQASGGTADDSGPGDPDGVQDAEGIGGPGGRSDFSEGADSRGR
ncbi:dipeptide/oligopeptide/nickel ABC transporter permease/ATP-binding protein [Planomonospora parontospora]|uniref:dipeptide/oligopeptide/nickel ABC transporter permease/ATP-binding protein n=1 Tax=Planomonospora parontospora TaxID=58119 RepID=UPI001670A28D|nr:dipeptide/oligopeptide/nickel ABC transporter permease/ATP-binding protein [Planomonospora parontospora]GGL25606.1 peptide ABC transporter ATP-binding protein [Planomonospora parontospora subsp. antibiotica]GII16316.1 peptide ABC transporter ATP-binding protein [Planomonospora parontospora subsp. antibiotica]